ncbi:MAG TPA: CehA/McbA family metallohydrolase [Actinomycetota bacterium]|nr:CehA/McbA family metallohydrolase [Actinomycetota bacterium]
MRKLAVALLLVALLAVPTAPASAVPPAACPGGGTPTQVFTGTFGSDMEGAYVLVPFNVPDGTTRVRVKLCYDQPDSPTSSQIKHTLDLGLYGTRGADGFFDVEEFRGWGGSSRLNAFVTPEEATLGFKPGPIPAGEWAAEMGVAAVADVTEGDFDGRVAWRLEIFLGSSLEDLDQPWQPAPYDTTPARSQPGWYKGDFHVHAEHSNPNGATMRETFDYAFSDRPAGAGLDFITLSDYVTDRHWDEIGRFQADYPSKLIVRSAEVITYRGHINNHASVTLVDYRTGSVYELSDGALTKVRDAQPASRIFQDIRAGGGFTQINHPTTFPSDVPMFANLCRGCSWEYSDEETNWSLVDAMEIQTGPAGTPDPDGHEVGPNPFTPLAIEWWDRLRNQGYRITGLGSSDSHNAGHETVTQSPIGEPTTVVYAKELSEKGVQEAIRAGHAYVKFFSSDGPDLRFTARSLDGPGKGPKGIMGDRLRATRAEATARVLGAAPDPEPRTLIVMKDGAPWLSYPVISDDFTATFVIDTPGHYRLQLMRGSAFEALTNPITLSPPPPRGRQ